MNNNNNKKSLIVVVLLLCRARERAHNELAKHFSSPTPTPTPPPPPLLPFTPTPSSSFHSSSAPFVSGRLTLSFPLTFSPPPPSRPSTISLPHPALFCCAQWCVTVRGWRWTLTPPPAVVAPRHLTLAPSHNVRTRKLVGVVWGWRVGGWGFSWGGKGFFPWCAVSQERGVPEIKLTGHRLEPAASADLLTAM